MNADWVVAVASEDHQGQRGGGEYQLDDHVGGKDRLRAQRRGAQPLEDAALAVDGDNRNQRKHSADGDQNRHENRYTHADETAGGERGYRQSATGYSTQHEESQNRENDGAESAKRLVQEDLYFDPSQFPASAHNYRTY